MQTQLWRTQRKLYSTGPRWGFALGVTEILAFALGVTQILVFLDTNMLVSPTQNSCVRGIAQYEPQHEEFFVAVEYRL